MGIDPFFSIFFLLSTIPRPSNQRRCQPRVKLRVKGSLKVATGNPGKKCTNTKQKKPHIEPASIFLETFAAPISKLGKTR